ncbi:hypothetical protein MRX96_015080 [Rhipicephalus microplus]
MEAVLKPRQPRGLGGHGHRSRWRLFRYRDGPVDEVATAIVPNGGRFATETAPWTRWPRPSSPMEAVLLQRRPRGRGGHGHRPRWRPFCYRDGPVDEVATAIVPDGGRFATETAPWTRWPRPSSPMEAVLLQRRPRGRGGYGHRHQWRPFSYRDGPVDEVATAIVPNGGRSATETGPWTRWPRPSSPMEAVLLQRQPRGRGGHGHSPQWRPVLLQRRPRGRGRHGHRPQWRPFCYRDGPVDEVAMAIVTNGGRSPTRRPRGRGRHGHRLRWRPYCYRDGPVDEVATAIVSDGGRSATETAPWTRSPRPSSPMEAVLLQRRPCGRGRHGHRPQWRPFCY